MNALRPPLLLALAFLSLPARSEAPVTAEPGLWSVYTQALAGAKYVDLTHAFAPAQPVWPGFGPAEFGPAIARADLPGGAAQGDVYTYDKHGFVATRYVLPSDQYGTQLDPPAHWDPRGATISDLPATFALRPLVVVDVHDKVAADPGYVLAVADIEAWEARHGRVPEGAVVMVRSDWSKRWGDPARFVAKPFPGVGLDALKFLHQSRNILFHGHEPLDTDATPSLEGEAWLMHNGFAQAEGVTNLDQVPEAGALVAVGFAKPLGGTGGFARYVAICPADWPHGVTVAEAPGAPLPKQIAPLARDGMGVLRPGGRR